MSEWLPEGTAAEPAVRRPVAFGARLAAAGHATLRLGRAVLDTALPPVCLACRRPVADDHALCVTCWGGLAPIERPFCDRLGTPFMRLTDNTGRRREGAGLGLSVVKALAAVHGGTLDIRSLPGHGTTVAVDLPVAMAGLADPVRALA